MLENFLNYLRYEKKYSSHTVLSYKTDIKQFEKFLIEKKMHAEIETVENQEIRLWIVDLIKDSKPATVRRKISAIKSYYRFLLKNGKVSKNPATGIVLPKKSEILPSFFSEKEMDLQQFHDHFNKETEFESVRNDLIIEFFYQTGIRRAELISLKDSDIDFSRKTLKVFGKRKKERIIPLGENLLDKISNYIEFRNKETARQDSNFFVLPNGKEMYPNAVYKAVVRRMGEVSTLAKHSPHVLRHTFATTLLNNGAELNAVKELLGHSSLASTQVYTHTTFKDLQKIYRQAHPRAEKR
ncbi:MAG: tyrosine-type recombinase/integrase [Prevotellaceae bacterium]|jgi:integrase/recombinase XerC|nr:tyrosine-type recombinase/integrase [Prevotellaceae bacterium]